jgi:hypothetical protein
VCSFTASYRVLQRVLFKVRVLLPDAYHQALLYTYNLFLLTFLVTRTYGKHADALQLQQNCCSK